MALNEDKIQLSVEVKASQAQAELLKLREESEKMQQSWIAQGKSLEELGQTKAFKELKDKIISTSKEAAAFQKQAKEREEKDAEASIQGIWQKFGEESASIRELEKLRRHARAKAQGTGEKDDMFEENMMNLAKVEARLAKMRDEMAQVKKEMKLDGNIFKDAAVIGSASLNQLSNAAEALDAKLKRLSPNTAEFVQTSQRLALVKDRMNEVEKSLKPVIEDTFSMKSVLGSIKTASLESLKRAAHDLGNELEKLTPDTKEFIEASKNLGLVKSRYDELKGSVKETSKEGLGFKDIVMGSAAGNVIADVAGKAFDFAKQTAKEAYEAAKQYQLALSELSAITGASGKDLAGLEMKAQGLTNIMLDGGLSITNSASDILTAFKLVGSAKPELLSDAEALSEVTKQTIILSKATGLSLPEAVKHATTILNQFEAPAKDTARYINAIAAGAKEGAAEIPDVADAIKEFGAGAKSANVSIEESVALTEVLGDKMIKGSEAGTSLRNILLTIKAPDALGKDAIKELNAHGVSMKKLSDTTLPLSDRLKELSKIKGDATAMVKVFGKENVTAGEIVLNNVTRFDELNSKLKDTNEAYRQAAAMANNLGTTAEAVSNNWKSFLATLGEHSDGALKVLMHDLNDVINDMTGVIDPTQKAGKMHNILAQEMQNLSANIKPMLDEYDELAKKNNRTTAEQARLEEIVRRVSAAVPGVVQQFNEYGEAMSISTTKARALIDVQALMTEQAKGHYGKSLSDENENLNKRVGVLKGYMERGEAEAKWFQLMRKADASAFREMEGEISKSLAKIQANKEALGQLKAPGPVDEREAMMKREEEALKKTETDKKALDNTIKQIGATKEHHQKVELLAGSVGFLRQKYADLGKELEGTPITNQKRLLKLMEDQKKASEELAKAEDILFKLREKQLPTTLVSINEQYSRLNKLIETTPLSNPEKLKDLFKEQLVVIRKINEEEEKVNKIRSQAKGFTGEVQELTTIKVKKVDATGVDAKAQADLDVKLDKAVVDAKLQNEIWLNQRKKEEREKLHQETLEQNRQYLQAGVEAARMVADTIFSIQNQRVEREKNTALKALDKEYKSKIDHAKANTRQKERLEAEYDKKKQDIEKEAFERNKRMAIAQAVINGALAITKILADVPKFDFGITTWIQVGLATLTTAMQVAAINSQKFAKGGVIQGASHADGGIKMVDSKTGGVVGEMEGGEPYMILSDNTYRNNKEVIDALLNSSINEGGKRIFADGGVFSGTATTPNFNRDILRGQPTTVNIDLMMLSDKIDDLIDAVKEEKTRPASLSFQALEETQDLVATIRRRAANA